MWIELTSDGLATTLVHLSACKVIYWPAVDNRPASLDLVHPSNYAHSRITGPAADQLWRHIQAGSVWRAGERGEGES